MEQRIVDIAIAGLLHDIGEVVQRAQEDPGEPRAAHSPAGQPDHAKGAEGFIQNSVPQAYRSAALQGIYCHLAEGPRSDDTAIRHLVALADYLSAGEAPDEPSEGESSRSPRQLVSIFDRIGAYREKKDASPHFLPLAELHLDRGAIFPTAGMDAQATGEAYRSLKKSIARISNRMIDDPETYLENLQAGLQRYTWCVPSACSKNLRDVSLYDHSRMTAALAVCFSEQPAERIEPLLSAVQADFNARASAADAKLLEQPAALLVGGDISGIQNFIYTLSARKAAKTLRGRSFYLQLLTEAIMRFLLRELNIPAVNVIYSGGGHFYLLAPLSAAEKMPAIQRRITQTLLKHHGSSLYLALGWAEIPFGGFKKGAFPSYWNRMHMTLSAAKQHRYQELGGDIYTKVFEPIAHGGNQENTCSVCGEEKLGSKAIQDEDETIHICPLCSSFIDPLGKSLPDAAFVQLTFGEPVAHDAETALDALAELGMGVQFFDKDWHTSSSLSALPHANRTIFWALEDADRWPDNNGKPAAHLLHYTVNKVPEKTFDELQEEAHGIKRLGVLRMDVDNLGNTFKDGFGKGKESIATLARLSTLSFQMSLFFDGWVKKLCEQTSKNIYAVYAGGDDLFLIAPWDIVPDLAATIAADFSQYTSANPDLHLSGGMAFIHGKYPVYQAADDAGEAVERAKDREGKNAFDFLGSVWSWQEFAVLQQKFALLLSASQKPGAPASLLQLLQQLASMDEAEGKRGGRRVMGRWLWLGDYQFTRMIERARENEALKADLNQIHDDLKPYYEKIHIWGKAARWVQLYLRETSEKEKTNRDS